MNEPDLFPEIVTVKSDPKPKPCDRPYFMVAYWPKGPWWKIFSQNFGNPKSRDATQHEQRAREAGWTHIHWLKMPSELWEGVDAK